LRLRYSYLLALSLLWSLGCNSQTSVLGSLSFLGVTQSSTPLPPGNSLKQLASQRGFYIGTQYSDADLSAVGSNGLTGTQVAQNEFNIINDSGMKFDAVEPSAPTFKNGIIQPQTDPTKDFSFSNREGITQFAVQNNMKVHAHVLLYFLAEPQWLTGCATTNVDPRTCSTPWTSDELNQIMKYHIQTQLTYFRNKYPGSHLSWDVANEVAYDNLTTTPRHSVFEKIVDPATGQNSYTYYLKLAFQYAHAAEPDSLLCLNDNGGENLDGQRERDMYALAKLLKDSGAPITCVGFEMHKWLASYGGNYVIAGYDTERTFLELFYRYADIGLKVNMSELDMGLPLITQGSLTTGAAPSGATKADNNYRIAQGQQFGSAMSACLASPNCVSITTWGMNPTASWEALSNSNGEAMYGLPAGFSGDGLLFNADWSQKPSYTAFQTSLLTALQNSSIAQANQIRGLNSLSTLNGSLGQTTLSLVANDSASTSLSFNTNGGFDLHVQAAGGSSGLKFDVLVDGAKIQSFTSSSQIILDYTSPIVVSSGTHTISVVNNSSTPAQIGRIWAQPVSEYSHYIPGNQMQVSGSATMSATSTADISMSAGSKAQTTFTVLKNDTYEILVSLSPPTTTTVVATLTVDGTTVNNFSVVSTGYYKDYRTLIALAPGSHTIGVQSPSALNLDHVFVVQAFGQNLYIPYTGMNMLPAGNQPRSLFNSTQMVLTDSFSIPTAGTYQISMKAAGHQVADSNSNVSYPIGQLTVDGISQGQFTASFNTWADYPLQLQLSAGSHTLAIQQLNYTSEGDGDFLNNRTMVLDSVTISPSP
jgi:endo-1,4-beta-xylanase